MIICANDKQVRNAIAGHESRIGIRLIDNASNAIFSAYTMGLMGAVLSQQKNTTPGMQAILQEAGYKYKETKFVFLYGQVMHYEKSYIKQGLENREKHVSDNNKDFLKTCKMCGCSFHVGFEKCPACNS